MSSNNSFKNNVISYLFIYKSYVYKLDLTLDNPLGLIKHQQTKR